jgi:hypothetical protein
MESRGENEEQKDEQADDGQDEDDQQTEDVFAACMLFACVH